MLWISIRCCGSGFRIRMGMLKAMTEPFCRNRTSSQREKMVERPCVCKCCPCSWHSVKRKPFPSSPTENTSLSCSCWQAMCTFFRLSFPFPCTMAFLTASISGTLNMPLYCSFREQSAIIQSIKPSISIIFEISDGMSTRVQNIEILFDNLFFCDQQR